MKRLFTLLPGLVLLVSACNLSGEIAPPATAPSPEVSPAGAEPGAQPTPAASEPPTAVEAGPEADTYWVTNPTGGARLFVRVVHPRDWDGAALPTLVLVPGGSGSSSDFLRPPGRAQVLADAGYTVVIFDPDGRGESEGDEDNDGFTQQDGLAAVVQMAASLPEADSSKIGLVSYSFGVTMASGALARHPDLPARFLIDWEGPADRNDTGGCDAAHTGHLEEVADCDDEAFWAEREALTFISQIGVPYQRLQSERDHVQPDATHAINMINAAVEGGVPWVRLNDLPPNQTYDPASPPPLLPDSMDRRLERLVPRYADELLALP